MTVHLEVLFILSLILLCKYMQHLGDKLKVLSQELKMESQKKLDKQKRKELKAKYKQEQARKEAEHNAEILKEWIADQSPQIQRLCKRYPPNRLYFYLSETAFSSVGIRCSYVLMLIGYHEQDNGEIVGIVKFATMPNAIAHIKLNAIHLINRPNIG